MTTEHTETNLLALSPQECFSLAYGLNNLGIGKVSTVSFSFGETHITFVTEETFAEINQTTDGSEGWLELTEEERWAAKETSDE